MAFSGTRNDLSRQFFTGLMILADFAPNVLRFLACTGSPSSDIVVYIFDFMLVYVEVLLPLAFPFPSRNALALRLESPQVIVSNVLRATSEPHSGTPKYASACYGTSKHLSFIHISNSYYAASRLIFEATRRLHFIKSTSPATGVAVTSEENRVGSKWIKVRVPFCQQFNSILILWVLKKLSAELGSWVIAGVDFSALFFFGRQMPTCYWQYSVVSVLENQSFVLRNTLRTVGGRGVDRLRMSGRLSADHWRTKFQRDGNQWFRSNFQLV
ncbi:hypothetical protein DFH09DRAFT_1118179 [Mycena vulgaris]|nr:hypothetical protein DFH09DRAFT_1118179 [Mycena vulgaris]